MNPTAASVGELGQQMIQFRRCVLHPGSHIGDQTPYIVEAAQRAEHRTPHCRVPKDGAISRSIRRWTAARRRVVNHASRRRRVSAMKSLTRAGRGRGSPCGHHHPARLWSMRAVSATRALMVRFMLGLRAQLAGGTPRDCVPSSTARECSISALAFGHVVGPHGAGCGRARGSCQAGPGRRSDHGVSSL
jgi:hypothetical protein